MSWLPWLRRRKPQEPPGGVEVYASRAEAEKAAERHVMAGESVHAAQQPDGSWWVKVLRAG